LTAGHISVSFENHSAGKTKLQKRTDEQSSVGRLVVPSLTVAFFSMWTIESITSVFLLNVAATFFGSPTAVSIATTAQLVTLAGIVSVVFGVVVGILSVRYNHKKLLLLGVLGVTLGQLGCFLSPNFLFMQIFYPVEGIGSTLIDAMALALVGELLILSKRGRATGWVIAGAPMATIAGALMIYLFFSGAGGWRSFLLWFALPISLISLTAVYFGVPSSPQKPKTVGKEAYLSSFKQVFLKKSAASCLIGIMLRQASFAWATVYSVAFYRTKFGLPTESGALIALSAAGISVLANIVGGYMVNRVGRKRLQVATLVVSSLPLALIAFVPNLWIVLAINFSHALIFVAGIPAGTSLALEQAPESRGTMMSMHTIFVYFGFAIGSALGGAALVLSGWTGLVLTFAALSLIAAAVLFFLTKDPTKTQSLSQNVT
jgi:predicted MFS family arabinose efflux permease